MQAKVVWSHRSNRDAILVPPVAGLTRFYHPRLHHAIRAFHELLLTLDCLHRSKVEEQQEFAATMLAIVFYDFDFMEWLPRLCRTFTLKKQSRAFLKDLILAVHFTLKMISTLKSSEAYKIFTARRRRGGKKASKRAADGTAPTAAEQPEGEVDLSQLFEASEEQGESNKDLADRGREYEFDLKSYLLRFAEAKVVLTYTEVGFTCCVNFRQIIRHAARRRGRTTELSVTWVLRKPLRTSVSR